MPRPNEVSPQPPVNEVRLVGRLAAEPVERELPSGDRISSFRLVVERPPRRRNSRSIVDTIDCVAFRAAVRAAVSRLSPGQQVALDGVLHRRFWRGPAGPASRYEVEALRVRRAAGADRTDAPSAGGRMRGHP